MDESFQLNASLLNSGSEELEGGSDSNGNGHFFASLTSVQSVGPGGGGGNDSQPGILSPMMDRALFTFAQPRRGPELSTRWAFGTTGNEYPQRANPRDGDPAAVGAATGLPPTPGDDRPQGGEHGEYFQLRAGMPGAPIFPAENSSSRYPGGSHLHASLLLQRIAANSNDLAFSPDPDGMVIDSPPTSAIPSAIPITAAASLVEPDPRNSVILNTLIRNHSAAAAAAASGRQPSTCLFGSRPDTLPRPTWPAPLRPPTTHTPSDVHMATTSTGLTLSATSAASSDHALNCSELHSLHKRGETVTSVSKDVWGVLLSLSPKYPTRQLTKRDRHAEDKCGYMLGRHRECDLRLNHPQISNRHCLIYAVHVDGVETVFIKDLSTNGTYVNGAKLPRQEPRQLGDGDTIKLTGYSEGGALQDQDTDETFIFQHVTARRRDAQAATGAATGDDGPAPPRYSSFQSNYLILRPLGRGSFADVHMAANRLTGQQFAVKVIDKKKFQLAPRVIATAREEFNILISMHHPAVIAIHGVYDEADSLYMILEYARDGELFDEIVARNGFTESETRTIFFQLFTAIKYLHDRGVVHRDLKPENILLADRSTLTIKLTDFGLAKVVRDENTFMKTLCGTPNYVAPEVLVPGHERAYSRAVDMWSLGVILYICLCGFPPFSEDFAPPAMQFQIKEAIYSFPPPIWDRISGDAVDLVTRLLQKDPERRLTVEEALVHPWMRTTFDGVTYALDNGPTEVVDTTEAYAMEPQTQREAEPNGNGQNALNGPRDPVMFSPFRVPPGLITSSDVISSPAGPPGQGSDAAKNLLGQAKRKRDQSGSSFSSSASSSSSLFLGKPRKHPAIYPNQPLEPQSSNLFASSRYPDVPFQPHENDSQDCGPAGFAATTTTTTTLGQDLLDHGFSHADDSRPTVSLTVDRDDSFDPAVYFGRGSSSILMNHEIGGDGDDTAGLALPQLGRDLSSPLGRPELTVGQRQDHEDSAMQISRTNSPSSSLPKTPPTSGG